MAYVYNCTYINFYLYFMLNMYFIFIYTRFTIIVYGEYIWNIVYICNTYIVIYVLYVGTKIVNFL